MRPKVFRHVDVSYVVNVAQYLFDHEFGGRVSDALDVAPHDDVGPKLRNNGDWKGCFFTEGVFRED